MATLEEYKLHADKFGNEMVLETAQDDLCDEELEAHIKGEKYGKTTSRSHKRNLATKRRINKRR